MATRTQNQLFRTAAGLCLAVSLCVPASAAKKAQTVGVVVDQTPMRFSASTFSEGTTYLPVRETVAAVQPDAMISGSGAELTAEGDDFLLTAKVGNAYFSVNDRYLYVPDLIQANEQGEPMIPTRQFAAAMGITVSWDNQVILGSEGTPMQTKDRPLSDAEVQLIARVIAHESGSEPLEGRMAVGNVILNRVLDPDFPDSVSDVLYQKNQFVGATRAKADSVSILAAKLVAEGANVVPGAVWFNGTGKPFYGSRNGRLIAEIGHHSFYGKK